LISGQKHPNILFPGAIVLLGIKGKPDVIDGQHSVVGVNESLFPSIDGKMSRGNPEFAGKFLLASIDEGISLQHALGKVIRAMGVKEFAVKIGMESPNLLRAINPRHNPTQSTINRILNPWGSS
jgi:DNA-binding phage protein